METDRIIASLAAGQHAAVGRKQLLDAGLPAHAIAYRVRQGLLVPVHAGAYRVAGSPVTWHQRLMAATLAAGTGAVASHRAAGYLHGLDGIAPRSEVTVPRKRAPEPPGVIVHRIDLPASDTETRDRLPRTRPPATILGLAAVVPPAVLEVALDDALLRGLVSCGQLQRRLDAGDHRGRPGAAALGQLLAVRAGAARWTQSEFERQLLRLLAGSGIVLPIPQYEVVLPDGTRVYLDFGWPDVRVGLEAQSYRHHGGRLAWSRDQVRLAVVASLGWRIIPVTWEDVVRTPRELVATVLRARAA